MCADRSLELATAKNFDEQCYLLANPDIARHVQAGGNAFEHLVRHGVSEGRMQVVLSSEERLRPRRERFARLSNLIDRNCDFRFVDDPETFPIMIGHQPHDLSKYEAESANAGFGPFNVEMRDNPEKLYLDVGCGRRISKEPNCLYLEVYPSVSADIIMDPASTYPIRSGSLDGIGCFAVLEHVERPWEAAREFARMLKPGGKIFIDWPFLQPVHGYPSHYYNATREGLRTMFVDDFDIQTVDTLGNQTPDHTLSWILRSFVDGLRGTEVIDQFLNMRIVDLVAEPAGSHLWNTLINALPLATLEELACGNSLIATKR